MFQPVVAIIGLALLLIGSAAQAAGMVQVPGNISQGSLVVGSAPSDTIITFEDEVLPLSPDGKFVFGFGRDAGPAAALHVEYADGSTETLSLVVAKRDYNIQRIDGLPPKMVTPPPERQARLKRERGMVAAARNQFSDRLDWTRAFAWPAYGRVTGVYGSQRILNDVPKWPHYGLDVAGPTGTPVYAPAGGKVVLAEADFYYEGGIIIIDHGHGVMSTMFHMNSVDVPASTEVVQGQQVGTIGKTGRATGPHVDWRVNWNGRRLDPRFLVGDMPLNDPWLAQEAN